MTTFEDATETFVVIPLSEFRQAWQLRPLTQCDESDSMSLVRLSSDGRLRTWTATDGHEGARFESDPDSSRYDICLSWAQVRAAITFGQNDPSVDISIRLHKLEGAPVITVSGPYGSSTTWNRGVAVPDLDDLRIPDEKVGGVATAPVEVWRDAMFAVSYEREFDDGKSIDRITTVSFADNHLLLQKFSPASGLIKYQIPVEHSSSNVTITLDPTAVERVLAIAAQEDEVTITLSLDKQDPVWLKGPNWEGFVHPTTPPIQSPTSRAEQIIQQVFGPAALNLTDDGGYPLVTSGNAVIGKIMSDDNGIFWLNISSLVAADVPATPELFVELNDYNTNCQQVRLAYIDGQVLACVDLVAGTLDVPELELAVERIREVARNIMPLLTAVIGGVIPDDAYEARWASYRNTIVEAELSQGQLTVLTGEQSPAVFPFADRCFVITGCNPMGTVSSEQQKVSTHNWLAHQIIDHGGTFAKGIGRSSDGRHVEESLIVWGVEREFMRVLGRKVQQDAIFEIDNEAVYLIACAADQVESWSRQEPAGGREQSSLL